MATLVHITDAALRGRIARSGLSPGKGSRVVFFMPVLADRMVSLQWMRELRRRGVRNYLGVHFRLPDDTPTWVGHYMSGHRQMELNAAIGELMRAPDPMGWELFISGRVPASAITALRPIARPVGWRYRPDAHGFSPCGCPLCQPRGSRGGAAIRAERDPPARPRPYAEIKAVLLASDDLAELGDALMTMGPRRLRDDPSYLARLIALGDADLAESVAYALRRFRHPAASRLLRELSGHADETVRATAAESIAARK